MGFSLSMPPQSVAAAPPRMISIQPKPQSLAARRAHARAQLGLSSAPVAASTSTSAGAGPAKQPSLKIDLSQVASVPRQSDRNLKLPPVKPSDADLDQMSPQARATALNTFENWKLGKAKFDADGNQMKSPQDGSSSAVSLTHSSSTPSLSSLTTPSTGQSLAADGNFQHPAADLGLGLDLKPSDRLSTDESPVAASPRSTDTVSTVISRTASRRESTASSKSTGSPKSRSVSFLCGSKKHVLALGEETSSPCSCPVGTALNLIPQLPRAASETE